LHWQESPTGNYEEKINSSSQAQFYSVSSDNNIKIEAQFSDDNYFQAQLNPAPINDNNFQAQFDSAPPDNSNFQAQFDSAPINNNKFQQQFDSASQSAPDGNNFQAQFDSASQAATDDNNQIHPCTLCGKVYQKSGGLQYHMTSMHSAARPFTCDVCGKGFLGSHKLARHRRIHTGEKPYQCDVCGFRCNQVDNLRTHKLLHLRDQLKMDGTLPINLEPM
jgi:uncharacterized Zn-finger protein